MSDLSVFGRFGAALALGLMVGLQREYSQVKDENSSLVEGPGVRTFSITSLLGCTMAWFSSQWNSFVPFVLGLAVWGGLAGSAFFAAKKEQPRKGMTTEAALLVIYAIGGICWFGEMILATALAVILAVLLSFKMELHSFAYRLTKDDVVATLKFLVITAVVLPVLPDQYYGPEPFQIFNPFKIWTLVVFISGISFIGYILVKLVGVDRGIGLTGLLGGLASSTALTLSFTQRSKVVPSISSTLATAIVVAWTVMYARVLAVVWVLDHRLGQAMVLPMLLPVLPGLAWCLWLWFKDRHGRGDSAGTPDFSNPFELAPAIKFVVVLTAVIFVSKLAHLYFGREGLLISSFLAGFADVDAIAISMAQMTDGASDSFLRLATQAVVLAGIANTITKGTAAMVLGAPGMRKAIGPAMVLMVASGGIALLLI